MVIENINQYQAVNKFIISFITNNYSKEDSKDMLALWKSKKNINKFKSLFENVEEEHVKRPKSKYIYFCDETRKELKLEYPEMNIREITCELGKRWQKYKENPDPEMERKLTQLFTLDRERYNSQKKPVGVKPKNIYRSLYLYFCDLERTKNPSISMKELGERWNTLKNNDAQYEKLSKNFQKIKAETIKASESEED